VSLFELCEWLASTSWSIALHESRYAFLVVLTVHVLTLSVFVGTALMIDLRLLGVVMVRVPASQVIGRLAPWTAAGLILMVTSGALLFYAAPLVRYENIFFRMKMATLVLALLNAWLFHRTVYRRIDDWDRDTVPPWHARLAGGLSLVLWVVIIAAGRMMAYQDYWFP
jgi:hypothetical protein